MQAPSGRLGVARSAVAALAVALVLSLRSLLPLHILTALPQSMSLAKSSVTEALEVSIPEHADAWLAPSPLTTRTHWNFFLLDDTCLFL